MSMDPQSPTKRPATKNLALRNSDASENENSGDRSSDPKNDSGRAQRGENGSKNTNTSNISTIDLVDVSSSVCEQDISVSASVDRSVEMFLEGAQTESTRAHQMDRSIEIPTTSNGSEGEQTKEKTMDASPISLSIQYLEDSSITRTITSELYSQLQHDLSGKQKHYIKQASARKHGFQRGVARMVCAVAFSRVPINKESINNFCMANGDSKKEIESYWKTVNEAKRLIKSDSDQTYSLGTAKEDYGIQEEAPFNGRIWANLTIAKRKEGTSIIFPPGFQISKTVIDQLAPLFGMESSSSTSKDPNQPKSIDVETNSTIEIDLSEEKGADGSETPLNGQKSSSEVADPSSIPSGAMPSTQGISKVATQATYDELSFLAQFTPEFEKSRQTKPTSKGKKHIEHQEEIEDEENDPASSAAHATNSILANTSNTLKSVLSSPPPPSVVGSLLKSMARSTSKQKKGFYSIHTPDTSRISNSNTSQRPRSTNESAFASEWASTHYSLVESSEKTEELSAVDDAMSRPVGTLDYNPDFEPYQEPRGNSYQSSTTAGGYEDVGDDDWDVSRQFGLNSQLPTQMLSRKRGSSYSNHDSRYSVMQQAMMMAIDDEESYDQKNSATDDPIDDIESSQDLPLSMHANPVDVEEELMRSTQSRNATNISIFEQSQTQQPQPKRSRLFGPTSISPSPMSSQAIPSSQSGALGAGGFLGSLQVSKVQPKLPAKNKKGAKKTSQQKKIGISNAFNAMDEIEEEEGDEIQRLNSTQIQSSQFHRSSTLDASVFDHDKIEAIEEFAPSEITAATVAYDPYKLVANSANHSPSPQNGSTAVSRNFHLPKHASNTPANASTLLLNRFMRPGATTSPGTSPVASATAITPGSVSPSSYKPPIGSSHWLQTIVDPFISPYDATGNRKAPLPSAPHLLPASSQPLAIVVALVSTRTIEDSYQMVFGFSLSDDSNDPGRTGVVLIFKSLPSLVFPGLVLFCPNAKRYVYSDQCPVLWPYHAHIARQEPVANAPVCSSSVAFETNAQIVEMASWISLPRQPDLLMVQYLAQTTISVEPAILSHIAPRAATSLSSPQQAPSNRSAFVLPHAAPQPHYQPPLVQLPLPTMSPATTAAPTKFSRHAPAPQVIPYTNPLGFAGSFLEVAQQVLILAIFARPFSLSPIALFEPQPVPQDIASLSFASFRKNWSQSTANLEECARIKRQAFYRRSAHAFTISSISSDKKPTLHANKRTALALIKRTKTLVWLDFEFEGADPGSTWTLNEASLRSCRSTSTVEIHSLVEDSIKMFGLNAEDVSNSFASEPRSKVRSSKSNSNQNALDVSMLFPSSQEAAMEVENATGRKEQSISPSERPRASQIILPCYIPRISISKKSQRTVGSTRSSDDRLLKLFEDNFDHPRRISTAGLIVSPMKLIRPESSKMPKMWQTTFVCKNWSDSFELQIPDYIWTCTDAPLDRLIFFDQLLQVSSKAFRVDGFTHMFSLRPTLKLSNVRMLERSNVPWDPKVFLCGPKENIKYKLSDNNLVSVSLDVMRTEFEKTTKKLAIDASDAGTALSPVHNGEHDFVCPQLHRDVIMLPTRWQTQLYLLEDWTDRLGFCRTCMSTVTPTLQQQTYIQ